MTRTAAAPNSLTCRAFLDKTLALGAAQTVEFEPILVLVNKVNPGLRGEQPSLSQLDKNGDLLHTVDLPIRLRNDSERLAEC